MKTYCAVVLLALVAMACQPGAKGVWDSKTVIKTEFRRDGAIVYEVTRDAQGKAEVIAPKNASTAPSLDINEAGVTTVGSAEWEEAAVDWAQKNTWVYYAGSLLFLALAVAAWWFLKSPMLAGILGIAAGLTMFAPSIVQYGGKPVGKVVGYTVAVLFVVAVAYAFAQYVMHKWQRKRAAEAEAKLIKEGRPAEAEAIRRITDPTLDRAYRRLGSRRSPQSEG